mmetsp:Transcript_37635/g.49584  ORF Transcript_37635/g.49584 Transcript_37635/m.49584 type:complete len:699 (-) Transcript_37635:494-2590(-)
MSQRPVGASARQDLFGNPSSRLPTSRSDQGASFRGGGTPYGETPPMTGGSGKEGDVGPSQALVEGAPSGKIGDDIMELEHAMGYTGHFLNTVDTHPQLAQAYTRTLGSVVVISDLDNPHDSNYLKGHDMEISCLAISPSGNLLASGQLGTTHYKGYHAPVIVWDFQNKERIFVLEGITVRVISVAFSPDEAFLAGSGEDGVLYIWDLQTGEVAFGKRYATALGLLQWVMKGQEGRRPYYKIMMSEAEVVTMGTFSFDTSSRQWNLNTEPMVMPGSGLVREYQSSCLTPDGLFCIAGTTVGDFAVFRADSCVYRASLPVCSGGLTAVASNEVDGFLYCGGGDGTVKKVRGTDLRWQLHSEVQLDGRISSLEVIAGGAEVLVGTSAGSIFRVNCEDLSASSVHDSHISPVTCTAFPTTRSDVFATGAMDGSMVVWDLNDYNVVCRAGQRNVGGCLCLGWVGEAEIVGGFEDCAVRAYQVATGQKSWEIPTAHRTKVMSLAVHTDENMGFLVTGAEDGTVRVWALRTREMLLQFTEHKKGVTQVLVDVQQKHLIHSSGLDCAVFTYDIQKERRTVVHMVREGAFLGMSQRIDSEQELMTCDSAGRLFAWDCDIPDPVQALQDPSRQQVCSCAISPTGKFMAIGGEDQLVKVLDMSAEGDIISAGHGHSDTIKYVTWSPDERQIISVGDDCSICVWNFYGPP